MRGITVLLLLITGQSLACASTPAEVHIHGRLTWANGNPGLRIWVVGTKRILGVAEDPPESSLIPKRLSDIANAGQVVFADFTLIPLTPDEPGFMRMVRVIRADHVVITDGNLKVLQLIAGIGPEPNQSPEPALPTVTAPAEHEPCRP
jgi:hypothetical protein